MKHKEKKEKKDKVEKKKKLNCGWKNKSKVN